MKSIELRNRYLKESIKSNALWYVLMFVCLITSGIARPAGANYVQVIIDEMKPNNQRFFWLAIFTCCIIQVLNYGAKFASAFLCMRISNRMAYTLRNDLLNKLHRIPLTCYSSLKEGEVLSIIHNDAEMSTQFVYIVYSRIGVSILTAFFTIIFMLQINVVWTLGIVLFVVASSLCNTKILSSLRKLDNKTKKAKANLSQLALSFYRSIDVLRIFHASDFAVGLFSQKRDQVNSFLLSFCKIDSMRVAVYNLVSNILLYVSAFFLGYKAIHSSSSISEMLAYISLSSQLLVAIEMVFRWSGTIQKSMASWDRIASVINLEESNSITNLPNTTPKCIRFHNLSFGYKTSPLLFSNINICLYRGEINLLIGKSGAGKTTLFKCMMGMLPLNSGEVFVNSNNCIPEHLQTFCAYIPANCVLFDGTIYDNITFFNHQVKRSECIKLAIRLGLHDWIMSLPNGYDEEIKYGGCELSGGQRQMLCIMRAFLSDRELVIMDEPFSALDTAARVRLCQYLNEIGSRKILIYTSHIVEEYMPYDNCYELEQGHLRKLQ